MLEKQADQRSQKKEKRKLYVHAVREWPLILQNTWTFEQITGVISNTWSWPKTEGEIKQIATLIIPCQNCSNTSTRVNCKFNVFASCLWVINWSVVHLKIFPLLNFLVYSIFKNQTHWIKKRESKHFRSKITINQQLVHIRENFQNCDMWMWTFFYK